MPHSAVTKIERRDDGSIRLTVEIFGFKVGELVEISGNASQPTGPNGAIATFYHLQKLPPPASSDGGSLLTVIADPPSTKFVAGEITVVGRAAKIWSTVLDGTDEVVWKPRTKPPSNP